MLFLNACTAADVPVVTPESPTATLTVTPTASITAAPPTQTPTRKVTVTLNPTPTAPPPAEICSPLEDVALAELSDPELLKYPITPPRPGFDDGHHGVDFAYWSRGEHTTMLDLPIHSVLSGTVAAVLPNRMPYGNAVIIETALDALPSAWLDHLPIPAKRTWPTVQPAPNLYCPSPTIAAQAPGQPASLYLLYAHMDQPSSLQVGQQVACGDPIGVVGTTGKSVNPHLHLETRLGPANARFAVMGHYENNVTEEEMRAYCTWRVSGIFQMFDPMLLLSIK